MEIVLDTSVRKYIQLIQVQHEAPPNKLEKNESIVFARTSQHEIKQAKTCSWTTLSIPYLRNAKGILNLISAFLLTTRTPLKPVVNSGAPGVLTAVTVVLELNETNIILHGKRA